MSTSKPLVLLTGATGFVGAHVLESLLKSSLYNIVAPVRSPQRSNHLHEKYASELSSGQVTLVAIPDLAAPHALDDTFKRFPISYVVHLASPYFTTTNDPIKELVQPAIEATHNVMLSALNYGPSSLKKMTLLSSFASVVDLSKNPRPGYVYTSADWDPITEKQAAENGVLGYHASKTFAEREAWKLHDSGSDKDSKVAAAFDLVTLCPPMIYGPPIHYSLDHLPQGGLEGLNTSTARLIASITGKDPNFAPKVATPGLPAWIDVRDVAKAILASLSLPAGHNDRVLLCGGVDYYEDGMGQLRSRDLKNLGEPGRRVNPEDHFRLDTSKMRDLLGLQQTVPFNKTVEDTYDAVQELGLLG